MEGKGSREGIGLITLIVMDYAYKLGTRTPCSSQTFGHIEDVQRLTGNVLYNTFEKISL